MFEKLNQIIFVLLNPRVVQTQLCAQCLTTEMLIKIQSWLFLKRDFVCAGNKKSIHNKHSSQNMRVCLLPQPGQCLWLCPPEPPWWPPAQLLWRRAPRCPPAPQPGTTAQHHPEGTLSSGRELEIIFTFWICAGDHVVYFPSRLKCLPLNEALNFFTAHCGMISHSRPSHPTSPRREV